MAKMKAVQPEMMRLKELHKEDKVKLQQEMMALYRKEKINPASAKEIFPFLTCLLTKGLIIPF